MTGTNILGALSTALQDNVRLGATWVAGLDWGGRHHISALLWRPGVLVTSEQSLPDADGYTAALPDGTRHCATLSGRDPSTNVAVLRVESKADLPALAEPDGPGALVHALGSDGTGGVTARLGSIELAGPAWESMRGGRIDRLIRIDCAIGHAAEGGPVLNTAGGLLGMSTFGPRRQVLVIPGSTIARVVDQLLEQGRIMRGWLGAGMHPVALPRDMVERAGASDGLMVVNIAEGAPASGVLMPGDILLAIGDTPVSVPRQVAGALGPETVGETMMLHVLRGGALASLPVVIAARPA